MMSVKALMAFKVSVEKSVIILVGLTSYVIWPCFLTAFSILSSVHLVFRLLCDERMFLWSNLFRVLWASCTFMPSPSLC